MSAAPGVLLAEAVAAPAPRLRTGVPVFLGHTVAGPVGEPRTITLWPQFAAEFGGGVAGGYLATAVRGFFENEGLLCHVVRLADKGAPGVALSDGLVAADALPDADLVCAPDLIRTSSPATLQRQVLEHCQARGDRFAILDGVPGAEPAQAEAQAEALTGPAGGYGALYYPWVGTPGFAPPCGHVAGVYSRTDDQIGVHGAPANAQLDGVLDLAVDLDERQVGTLNALGVNTIRALRGRGIRVWGARTLSDDPAWRDIPTRRTVATLGRWIERFLSGLVHEPNDVRLWVRIMRELTAHLSDLHRRGALSGRTADEAFFVKCDGETNPPAVVDAGLVVTQIGVALAAPAEFTVVRIISGASGVAVRAA